MQVTLSRTEVRTSVVGSLYWMLGVFHRSIHVRALVELARRVLTGAADDVDEVRIARQHRLANQVDVRRPLGLNPSLVETQAAG